MYITSYKSQDKINTNIKPKMFKLVSSPKICTYMYITSMIKTPYI